MCCCGCNCGWWAVAAFETPLDYCLLALIRLATDFVESDGVIMAYGLWAGGNAAAGNC